MTPEHTDLLRRLFINGSMPEFDARTCPADVLRQTLVDIEREAKAEHPNWIDALGRDMLPRQIGCLPSEALDALAEFYLEHSGGETR